MPNQFLRAKKNISSKIAKSKAGEMIVKKYVGEDGFETIVQFEKCVANCYGKKSAEKWKKEVYRLCFKMTVILEDKKVKIEEIQHLKHPIEEIFIGSVDILCGIKKGDKNKNKLGQKLDRLFNIQKEIKNELLSIFKGKMTDKNLKSLEELMDYFDRKKMVELIFKEENNCRFLKIYENMKNLIEKFDLNALNYHKTKISNSVFSDKYSSIIQSTRSAFSKINDANFEKISNETIKKFKSKSDENAKILRILEEKFKIDDFSPILIKFVKKFLRMLTIWETLSEDLNKISQKLRKIEGISQEKISELAKEFCQTFLENLKAFQGKKFTSLDQKRAKIIFDLVLSQIF